MSSSWRIHFRFFALIMCPECAFYFPCLVCLSLVRCSVFFSVLHLCAVIVCSIFSVASEYIPYMFVVCILCFLFFVLFTSFRCQRCSISFMLYASFLYLCVVFVEFVCLQKFALLVFVMQSFWAFILNLLRVLFAFFLFRHVSLCSPFSYIV